MTLDERFPRTVARGFYVLLTANKHLVERIISVLWISVLPVSHFDSTKLVCSPVVIPHVFSHDFL